MEEQQTQIDKNMRYELVGIPVGGGFSVGERPDRGETYRDGGGALEESAPIELESLVYWEQTLETWLGRIAQDSDTALWEISLLGFGRILRLGVDIILYQVVGPWEELGVEPLGEVAGGGQEPVGDLRGGKDHSEEGLMWEFQEILFLESWIGEGTRKFEVRELVSLDGLGEGRQVKGLGERALLVEKGDLVEFENEAGVSGAHVVSEPVVSYGGRFLEQGRRYRPLLIVVGKRKYHLTMPLECLVSTEEDYLQIDVPVLDMVGTGPEFSVALQHFSEDFDYLYQRLRREKAESLGRRMRILKQLLLLFVLKVEE